MASDDEFYYYDDDDGEDEGGEDAEAAADWDGLALEADEDDLGLAEDDTPLRERRADCWVSIAPRPARPRSFRLRARAGYWARSGGFQPPRAPVRRQARPNFSPPFFLGLITRLCTLLWESLLHPPSNALVPRCSRQSFLTRSASRGMGVVSVNAD
jgi:hypothetical protein